MQLTEITRPRAGLVGPGVLALAMLGTAAGPALAQAAAVGQTYDLVQRYETAEQGDGGSSGSSSGQDTLVERVVAVRPDGVELVFDLPERTPPQQRAQSWQFPVRVFRPAQGPMVLLNPDELAARVNDWLQAARLERSACGRWVFTWTAMRIECDPASVLSTLRALDWRATTLAKGAAFTMDGARGEGPLARVHAAGAVASYRITLPVDPEAIRRERADADVVVGEITRQPVTLAAALQQRAAEKIAGTLDITLEADAQGQLARRTVVTTLEIVDADGRRERQKRTNTLERLKRP